MRCQVVGRRVAEHRREGAVDHDEITGDRSLDDAFRHLVEETLVAQVLGGGKLRVGARIDGVYSVALYRRRRTIHEHAWQSSMVRRNDARVDGTDVNAPIDRVLRHCVERRVLPKFASPSLSTNPTGEPNKVSNRSAPWYDCGIL